MKKRLNVYKDIMNGVSQMLPFVVAGGIFLALSFLFDSSNVGNINYGSGTPIASWLHDLGTLIFGFMLPILGGYIAYSIADRPGLVPGFIAGALAISGGSGFIGALLGGFIAGYIIIFLKRLFAKLPKSFNSIKPILIFPLLGSLLTALSMIGINMLMTPISEGLQTFLNNLNSTSAIIVGLVAGGMMAVDMGGPVNKSAYLVGVASITGGVSSILMAAVMVGGMVPPLGIALATLLFKHKFTEQQIELGKTNWVSGASFITEGAIPFAVAHPKTVMPSIIIGSAIAGGIVGFFKTSVPAPHGGVFVIFIMTNWWGFIIALLSGMAIIALALKVFLPTIGEEKV